MKNLVWNLSTMPFTPVLLILLWVATSEVEPLKDVQAIVPASVDYNSDAKLICLYDLSQNETLYSVKWYLGTKEFYRYVPKEVPAKQVFELPELRVDTSKSDTHKVYLKSVRHEQSGVYKCEVSADAPFFDTKVVSGALTVVEFPENSPLIQVEKSRYEVGEKVRANCSFGPSRPAANLTWSIYNSQKDKVKIENLPELTDGNGRIWVKSRLETDTDANSFRNGRIRIKCVARVFSNHAKEAEIQIEEQKPRSASVMGSKNSSGRGSETVTVMSHSSSLTGISGPLNTLGVTILGLVLLSVNCISWNDVLAVEHRYHHIISLL